jgi:hypothetical protein
MTFRTSTGQCKYYTSDCEPQMRFVSTMSESCEEFDNLKEYQ